MSDPDLRERGDEVNQLVQELVELVRGRDDETLAILRDADEREVYADAVDFYEREFDADVRVFAEDDAAEDPGGKAGDAVPFRPAVHIE
jgi:leucyl-tRNA synthetase